MSYGYFDAVEQEYRITESFLHSARIARIAGQNAISMCCICAPSFFSAL